MAPPCIHARFMLQCALPQRQPCPPAPAPAPLQARQVLGKGWLKVVADTFPEKLRLHSCSKRGAILRIPESNRGTDVDSPLAGRQETWKQMQTSWHEVNSGDTALHHAATRRRQRCRRGPTEADESEDVELQRALEESVRACEGELQGTLWDSVGDGVESRHLERALEESRAAGMASPYADAAADARQLQCVLKESRTVGMASPYADADADARQLQCVLEESRAVGMTSPYADADADARQLQCVLEESRAAADAEGAELQRILEEKELEATLQLSLREVQHQDNEALGLEDDLVLDDEDLFDCNGADACSSSSDEELNARFAELAAQQEAKALQHATRVQHEQSLFLGRRREP